MPQIEIKLATLQQIAQNEDLQLIVRNEDGEDKLMGKEVGWGGRLMRQLKVTFGNDDRRAKQLEYRDAKQSVFTAIKKEYGEDIARRAIRAGIGNPDTTDPEKWVSNNNFPITGRHIAKMLQVAEAEVALLRQPLDRFGDDGGTAGRQLQFEKISTPRGRLDPGVAFKDIATELIDDVRSWHNDNDEPHGFWALGVTVDSDWGGPRPGAIGIRAGRDNPDEILVIDIDGSAHQMALDDFEEWLGQHRQRHIDGDIKSVALYCATEKVEEVPQEVGNHIQGGIQNDEITIVNDDLPNQEEIPPLNFELTGDRTVANARHLVPDGDWNTITDNYRTRLNQEDPRWQLDGDFQFHVRQVNHSRNMTLQVGDGDRSQLDDYTTLPQVNRHLENLKGPDGIVLTLPDDQRHNLVRFLDDSAFLQTYHAVCEQLTGERGLTEPSVDVAFQINHDQDGKPVLDVTFRARLPNDWQPDTDGEPIEGSSHGEWKFHPTFDVAMTVRVPWEQVTEQDPQIELGEPRLEARQPSQQELDGQRRYIESTVRASLDTAREEIAKISNNEMKLFFITQTAYELYIDAYRALDGGQRAERTLNDLQNLLRENWPDVDFPLPTIEELTDTIGPQELAHRMLERIPPTGSDGVMETVPKWDDDSNDIQIVYDDDPIILVEETKEEDGDNAPRSISNQGGQIGTGYNVIDSIVDHHLPDLETKREDYDKAVWIGTVLQDLRVQTNSLNDQMQEQYVRTAMNHLLQLTGLVPEGSDRVEPPSGQEIRDGSVEDLGFVIQQNIIKARSTEDEDL